MNATDFSDSIHLEQLEIFARIGVPDQERQKPQRLTFTLTLWPAAPLHDLADDISRTINYSAVARAVREFADEQRVRLIETLAENVAQHLLKQFPIRRLQIELRKYVLPDAQFVAVRLTREPR